MKPDISVSCSAQICILTDGLDRGNFAEQPCIQNERGSVRFKVSTLQVIAGAILATLLSAYIVCLQELPAQATPTTQTLNMVGGNIDAQHPQGSADPYTDVSIDNGVTWMPAILSGGGHPYNRPAGVNSWLNCQSVTQYPWDACTQAVASQTPGASVRALFRYRFYIAADYFQGSLGGEFNVDNYAKFYLNGVDSSKCFLGCTDNGGLGIASWYGQTRTVEALNGNSRQSVNSLLQAGWNTFYVELLDTGGQSGITYNLNLQIQSSYAITVAAPGTLVTFDPQQGTASATSESIAYQQALSSITMPTAQRSGYTFDGWFTAPTGGTLVTPTYAASTIPVADMTLYAHWTRQPNVLTYDGQGGAPGVATQDVAYGQPLSSITLTTAQRSGYTFDGWYTASTGGVLVDSAYAAATTPAGPLTLYARWTAVPDVVVAASTNTQSALAITGTSFEQQLQLAITLLGLGIATLTTAILRRRYRAV